MLNDGPTPAEPRPASTVLLMRGSSLWEVLMMRRPGGADFAPGAHVFPGGSVHAEDAAFPDPYLAAAVRELFEELGILLARGPRGFAKAADCERVRWRVQHGVGFQMALSEAGLVPAFDRLAYFANWVTPARLRRRFDTRFYLARLPAGQAVHPQPGEVDDWLWVNPVQKAPDEGFNMVFVTRMVLKTVATEPDAGRLIAKVRRRRRVRTRTPVVDIDPTGKVSITIPD